MTTPRYAQRNRDEFDYATSQEYGQNERAELQESSERGGRRQKLAGYLRAANELRQSYRNSASTRWEGRREEHEDEEATPGSFPDVSIVRHGNEELILFPSYCKRHIKQQYNPDITSDDPTETHSGDDADSSEWWKKEWEKHEDDKAIVDVDVRGWVYTPHTGPMNRKNRLLLGLARQLSGVPAPKTTISRGVSPDHASLKARHKAREELREQERIALEAEEIMRKGENETEIAARGGYSEGRKEGFDTDTTRSDSNQVGGRNIERPLRNAPGPGHLSKRPSWNQPADMSLAELTTANANLMTRIMPFLTSPLVSTPITVFFYDNKSSQSRTVMTNESGHFNLRAALDFAPTHIRVLASENLSATEEVKITEPKGVSVISDVDDTIKHSSIGSGARVIFRNAFVRELSDLTIDGVKEWYNQMYHMGVGLHYVSNSPWQLFPVLATFFKTAGLPPGSYHLKQYSGMLQGIFEPVAERKKGTLERILQDFPERKFLLVGDSGEADLEVYTDVVLANPGRIIGVFIRDVTTPINLPFFDESYTVPSVDRSCSENPVVEGPPERTIRGTNSNETGHFGKPPPLPARPASNTSHGSYNGLTAGNLIDLDDKPDEARRASHSTVPNFNSDVAQLEPSQIQKKPTVGKSIKAPPPRPSKPLSLRSNTFSLDNAQGDTNTRQLPTEPSHQSRQRESELNNPFPQNEKQSREPYSTNDAPLLPPRSKTAPAHDPLPDVSSNIHQIPSTTDLSRLQSSNSSSDNLSSRQYIAAKAASYAASASDRLAAYRSSRSDAQPALRRPSSSDSDLASGATTPPINKKLDLWRKRWARAKEILDKEDVVLVKWRKGDDVADKATQLIESAMRAMGVKANSKRPEQKGKTGKDGGEAKVVDVKRLN